MTEETTQVVETQTDTQVNTDQPEQTLDDLYKESGLEASQTQTQDPTPQVQEQPKGPQQADVPDPFDVDNHKAYLKQLADEVRAGKEFQTQLQNSIQAQRQREYVAKLESDISAAADFVAKESGIENAKLATFELNERARTDAKFKALWEGRDSSPQAKAAFTKALKVISNDISKDYEVKTDPQLVANRKALAASRNSSATTSQEEGDNGKWDGMSDHDFSIQWERMVRNNN